MIRIGFEPSHCHGVCSAQKMSTSCTQQLATCDRLLCKLARNDAVVGGVIPPGYPEPKTQLQSFRCSGRNSFSSLSLVTFATMLAAETMGYSESAFGQTVKLQAN